ncbi:MAG TPA: helix-turn-helix transcriptional regulator [Thermoanaerobaculia bacterium]|nr:helix-turn-helix transcriptional regulator [Thermoanaerobaculia bacterium]
MGTFDRLGEALEQARRDAGMTQAELAEASHTGEAQISGYEHGELPTLAVLERILDALGITVLDVALFLTWRAGWPSSVRSAAEALYPLSDTSQLLLDFGGEPFAPPADRTRRAALDRAFADIHTQVRHVQIAAHLALQEQSFLRQRRGDAPARRRRRP